MTQDDSVPVLRDYEAGDWIEVELDRELDLGKLLIADVDDNGQPSARGDTATVALTLEGPDVWDAVNREADRLADSEVLHLRQSSNHVEDGFNDLPELLGTVWIDDDGHRADTPESEPKRKLIDPVVGIEAVEDPRDE